MGQTLQCGIFMTSHLLVCVATCMPKASFHVCPVAIAISECPEIRQMLVNLQSGMDPDEVEALMIKSDDDDEAATYNRKTRRLEHFIGNSNYNIQSYL